MLYGDHLRKQSPIELIGSKMVDGISTVPGLGLEGVFQESLWIYTLYITVDGRSSAPPWGCMKPLRITVEILPINRCRISSSSSMNIILWFDLVSTKRFWGPLCIILLDCVTPSCFWNRTFPCDITYSMLLMFVPTYCSYTLLYNCVCLTWLLLDLFFHWFSQLGVVCEDTSRIVVYTPAI